MADDLANEGTVTFFLEHKNVDWTTDRDGYNFPDVQHGPISVSARKHPDRTVSIEISGPFGNNYDFREPIPECDERGLHVAITWGKNEVKLYLNGKPVKTRSSPRKVN